MFLVDIQRNKKKPVFVLFEEPIVGYTVLNSSKKKKKTKEKRTNNENRLRRFDVEF